MDIIFEHIDKESIHLTDEILGKIKLVELHHSKIDTKLSIAQKELENDFEKYVGKNISKKFEGLTVISNKEASTKWKEQFLEEWNDTLQLLRKIAETVILDENRPKWVKPEIPKGVQVDQFLHAFYYSNVLSGNKSRHNEFHERNKSNPEIALNGIIKWWAKLDGPTSGEDKMIYQNAPYLIKIPDKTQNYEH